jgi:hypothetical protein
MMPRRGCDRQRREQTGHRQADRPSHESPPLFGPTLPSLEPFEPPDRATVPLLMFDLSGKMTEQAVEI